MPDDTLHSDIPFRVDFEFSQSPYGETGEGSSLQSVVATIRDQRNDGAVDSAIGFLHFYLFDPSARGTNMSIIADADSESQLHYDIARAFYQLSPPQDEDGSVYVELTASAEAAGAEILMDSSIPALVYLNKAVLEQEFETSGVFEAAVALASRSMFLSGENSDNPPMLGAHLRGTLFLVEDAESAQRLWSATGNLPKSARATPLPASSRNAFGLKTISKIEGNSLLGAGTIPLADIETAYDSDDSALCSEESVEARARTLHLREQALRIQTLPDEVMLLLESARFRAKEGHSISGDLEALEQVSSIAQAGIDALRTATLSSSRPATKPAAHPSEPKSAKKSRLTP